jgi:hypothetical protein
MRLTPDQAKQNVIVALLLPATRSRRFRVFWSKVTWLTDIWDLCYETLQNYNLQQIGRYCIKLEF